MTASTSADRIIGVFEAPIGGIIEMMDGPTGNPVASGRLYRVCKPDRIIGDTTCETRFDRLRVAVHPYNRCRVIAYPGQAAPDGF